jgi:two-component system cell cycle sensor histidine kinase/response regulator CckA
LNLFAWICLPLAIYCLARARNKISVLTTENERLEEQSRQREKTEAEWENVKTSLTGRTDDLQALLEFLPIGIAVSRAPAGSPFQANRELLEMLGISSSSAAAFADRADALPKSLSILASDRVLRHEEWPMRVAAAENREILGLALTLVREDGGKSQVAVNAWPLRDASGKAIGAVILVQDLTPQKRAFSEQLAAQRRMLETQKLESLGVLAGGIAHDFNNLLTGILGNATLARLELPSGHASVRSALDNLESAALRAADLCKQMLAYTGKGRFVLQPLDLNHVVTDTAELLKLSVSQKVSVQLALEESLPSFDGDVTQIRQILLNLVINASEAIGERGGSVRIKTGRLRATREDLSKIVFRENTEPGEYVYFDVSDNGVGLDTKMTSRIFDPFFTTKFTGRGLGLAAVLGIVRSHRGAIKVESEHGRGTTFQVLFPASEVAEGRVVRPTTPEGNQAALARLAS